MYYSVTKRNEVLMHAIGTDLENQMPSGRSNTYSVSLCDVINTKNPE